MRKSKVRRTIDKWVKLNFSERNPIYIAEGSVFMFPQFSDPGEQKMYLVVWLKRKTPKHTYNEFACSCPGFWFSPVDECRHVKELKEAIESEGGLAS